MGQWERRGPERIKVSVMADEVREIKDQMDPDANPQNGAGENDGDGQKHGMQPMTFDEFLKSNKDFQAEFDRRVNKAINTAVTNERQKAETLADERVSEAEKLARMTKDERDRYNLQKREKALEAREREITRRELQATARSTLAEKSLPMDLADILDYTDADACSESMEKVEKIFQSAMATTINERLKGAGPLRKAPNKETDALAAMREQVEKAVQGGLY